MKTLQILEYKEGTLACYTMKPCPLKNTCNAVDSSAIGVPAHKMSSSNLVFGESQISLQLLFFVERWGNPHAGMFQFTFALIVKVF